MITDSIKKTIRYFKRNGIEDTLIAVQERLWEKRHMKYAYVPPSKEELERQAGERFDRPLKFTVLVPAYETEKIFLQDLILSVMEQSYKDYELLIADASSSNKVKNETASFQEQYDRISYIRLEENRGISGNTNAALEHASGDYICLLDHDDTITPDALYHLRKAIDKADRPVLIYSDEDKADSFMENFHSPNRKTDYDDEMFFTNNYICHLSAYRSGVIKELMLDADYDGSQDYDLAFRTVDWCRENCGSNWRKKIVHVDRVLYHWREHEGSTSGNTDAKTYAYEAGKRAIEAALKRRGREAEVKELKHLGFYRVEYGDVFKKRKDVGIIGGPVYGGGKIIGGAMDKEGSCIYGGLKKGFSGPVHRAHLQQEARAVDIRNMKVRDELKESYESALREKDAVQASLKLCREARKRGFTILYDPEAE
ncbi:MAG: glycosyltransferase [Lachnospiraceae bacterium]|nr:glycosyltransferase [Lachnospiraceae bacterium]